MQRVSEIIPPLADTSCSCCPVCGEPTQTILTESGANTMNMFGGKHNAGEVIERDCLCKRTEKEREWMRRESEKTKMLRMEMLRKKGISDELHRSMTFENDAGYNPKVRKVAMAYVSNWPDMLAENTGLLFTGGVGTGKTFYAACIVNALIDIGVFAVMTSLSKVIRLPFDGFDNVLGELASADLVVFDDVGAERDTSFAWERAFDTVDARVKARKPIIVTTNLSPAELSAAGNIREQRIYDRIQGACVPVLVDGASIRTKERERKADLLRKIMEENA